MANKDTGKVQIHGKEYLTVAYRVGQFRKEYPEYTVETELVDRSEEFVIVKATIKDLDGRVLATGHGEEYRASSQINRTSALENAETSAIGRALAAYKYTGTEFASADEVANAIHQQSTPQRPRRATMKQVELLVNKVKWGLQMYDKDEVVNFLDNVLGKNLAELLGSEMDEAIAKVDTAVREEKVRNQADAGEKPDVVLELEGDITEEQIATAFDRAG